MKKVWENLFQKRVLIYKKRDKETWQNICQVLKEAGMTGVQAGHYYQDDVSPNGIGGMLDPRNFGGKGSVDRETYYIRVPSSSETRVRELIRTAGIVPVIIEEHKKNR